MSWWHTCPLIASDVRPGDLVALTALTSDGLETVQWWPVGHCWTDAGTVEIDVLGSVPLEVPTDHVLLVRIRAGASAGRREPTPRWTRRSRSSAAR